MFKSHDTVKYYAPDVKGDKIAAFDFDKTLVTSRSGRKFLYNEDDIALTYPSVLKVLAKFKSEGYIIAIISNQRRYNDKIGRIFNRFKYILESQGISPYILIATGDDIYRKPEAGMFKLLLTLTGLSADVSSSSFYCGDAAGEKSDNPEYRWSDSDRLFAENNGLTFYTPDQIFT
jgi:bifunctional polynucleotide phosphatase/kinase